MLQETEYDELRRWRLQRKSWTCDVEFEQEEQHQPPPGRTRVISGQIGSALDISHRNRRRLPNEPILLRRTNLLAAPTIISVIKAP
jgi:hypothetical protein